MKKMVLGMLMSVGLNAFATPLAFQGNCVISDPKGVREIGKFSLDHAEAVAGNCPHVQFDFRGTNMNGEEKLYTIYVEHQHGDYAGIYLTHADFQMADAIVEKEQVLPVGTELRLGVRLSPTVYVACEAELK